MLALYVFFRFLWKQLTDYENGRNVKNANCKTYTGPSIEMVLGTDELDDENARIQAQDDEKQREAGHGPHGHGQLHSRIHGHRDWRLRRRRRSGSDGDGGEEEEEESAVESV